MPADRAAPCTDRYAHQISSTKTPHQPPGGPVGRRHARATSRTTSGWCTALLCLLIPLVASPALATERLVSVDGAITEVLYALGQASRLVGVDTTSRYPPEAQHLPSVGYKRALSAEGLLSLSPTLVLATDDAGPPEVLTQIRSAGVEIRQIADRATLEGLRQKIRTVAGALEVPDRGERLIARVERSLERLQRVIGEVESRPRVLFLLAVGSGIPRSAGRDTPVDTLIRLAGGENVLHQAMSGYKPLSPEAALAARPEVILISRRSLERLEGIDGVLATAGLAATPAGQARRVIALDGPLLFNFGPRLGTAAEELAGHLGTLHRFEVVEPADAAAPSD